MFEAADLALAGGGRLTLLFAREPEQELDLDEVESDRPQSARTPKPEKPPTSRALMWALLLVIVAGGAYVALDPDAVMKLIGQEQVTAPPSVPPPAVVRTPKPASPPIDPTDGENPNPALATGAVPAPAFAEGQQVLVHLDGIAPEISLSADSAGGNPGPSVRSGSVLIVLDAEWQHNGWVYQVRTEDGAKGWIAEKRLTAKP